MAVYVVGLTSALGNFSTEGGLDKAVLNGTSIQRTVNMVMAANGSNSKMVGNVVDGDSLNDTVQGLGDLGFAVED